MITYMRGDMFQSTVQTLVNPVNCFGTMGAGLAKDFRDLYPLMFSKYKLKCHLSEIRLGETWLYKVKEQDWVLNFPTKYDPAFPSQLAWIEMGLQDFVNSWEILGINSIAFPKLGCGLGQLDFDRGVKPLMEQYLSDLPIDIEIYSSPLKNRRPERI